MVGGQKIEYDKKTELPRAILLCQKCLEDQGDPMRTVERNIAWAVKDDKTPPEELRREIWKKVFGSEYKPSKFLTC